MTHKIKVLIKSGTKMYCRGVGIIVTPKMGEYTEDQINELKRNGFEIEIITDAMKEVVKETKSFIGGLVNDIKEISNEKIEEVKKDISDVKEIVEEEIAEVKSEAVSDIPRPNITIQHNKIIKRGR